MVRCTKRSLSEGSHKVASSRVLAEAAGALGMSPLEEDVAVGGSRSRDSILRAAWNIMISCGPRVLVRGDPSYIDSYVVVLCTGNPMCSCAWGIYLALVFM